MFACCAALAGCGGGSSNQPAQAPPGGSQSLALSDNADGTLATFSEKGFIDRQNPFFQPFGNGRRCSTCHVQTDAWSLTPATVQTKFALSDGRDPLFMPIDAANSPTADFSTVEARRNAYSLLLNKALIRMHMALPANAEFTMEQVDDPYGHASAAELSLFRRPLPSTNLKFLNSVMWDARESHVDANSPDCLRSSNVCFASTQFNLGRQANTAVLGHAQATVDLTPAELQAIVDFERGLVTAQLHDRTAGPLDGAGAAGGPLALRMQGYYFGINDMFAGDYRTRQAFNPVAMTLFDAWARTDAELAEPGLSPADAEAMRAARQSIARGQAIFNGRQFTVSGVAGLNDVLRMQSVTASCTTCHNVPNAGSHSTPQLFNTGISDASRRTPDLPLYTLKNTQTGETVQTTDPGLAMQTGKWTDIGRFKVPNLRALAARPPYFHNGSAANVDEVVDFYNRRFAINLTDQEKRDLAAFLKAL